MAKQKRRSLFGDSNLLDEVLYGVATGLGSPGADPVSRYKRRLQEEQSRSTAAAMAKSQSKAVADAPPIEVPVNNPAYEDMLGLSAQRLQPSPMPSEQIQQQIPVPPVDPNVIQQQLPGQLPGQPTPENPLIEGMIGGSALSDPPPFNYDAATQPGAPLSPPVRPKLDVYRDELTEIRKAPLDAEGKQKAMRLNKLLEAAQDPALREPAREELLRQYEAERQRLRPEDHIEQQPTVDSESETRVSVADNGMQRIMQPDGRIDVKDPTTKVELENVRAQQKQQDAQLQLKEQRRDQRRQAEAAKREEQRKIEIKAAEERKERYRTHYQEAIAEKSMSKRYDEAQKALESSYKRLNPKFPAKQFSPDEIRNYAMSRIGIDFQAKEAALNPTDPFEKQGPKTPEESLRQRMKDDPEGFKDDFDDVRERLFQEQMIASDDPQEPTSAEVFDAMIRESPESLEQEFDSFLSARQMQDVFDRGSPASPSDIDSNSLLRSLFGQPQEPEPIREVPPNPLRDGIDPDAVDDSVDTVVDPYESVVTETAKAMDSPVINKLEKQLGVDFGRVVDRETLDYLASTGSENPIEDAAKAMQDAVDNNKPNINLMSRMERDGAKRAFPLVLTDDDAALDAAGVAPGNIYRDGLGRLKEREAAKPKKTKSYVPKGMY